MSGQRDPLERVLALFQAAGGLTEAQVDELRADVLKGFAEKARRMYAVGLACGIPECCVAQFCRDISEGLLPAELRGQPGWDYVPCDECLRKERGRRP